jgi:hypothetical protein
MPHPNSQLHLYLSKSAVNAITCPQAFLDAYPIVKTEAIADENGEIITPAVYYTEADDALTVKEAMELYAQIDWWQDAPRKPVTDEADATHLPFTLVNPTGTLIMTLAGTFQAYAQATQTQLDPNTAIQSRDDWSRFIA